jgi:hypothetical protein
MKSRSSRTRAELKKIKRKFKQGKLLAGRSKLSGATISRALTGKALPSSRTMRKLIDSLDPATAVDLVGAYLMDQIPPGLLDRLCICIRGKTEIGCQCWDPLVRKILSYSPETRAALENIAELIDKQPPGQQQDTIHWLSSQGKMK